MNKVDKTKFTQGDYRIGKNFFVQILWYFAKNIFFKSSFPFNKPKILILRLFGAKIGKKVLIKPHVRIKFPWKLNVGDFVSIGECAWIDNIGNVTIGNHSTISQGAYLCTGNHDFKSIGFDLKVGEIHIEDGVWIGAFSKIGPNVTVRSHSVVTMNSIITNNTSAYEIYNTNNKISHKTRIISDED